VLRQTLPAGSSGLSRRPAACLEVRCLSARLGRAVGRLPAPRWGRGSVAAGLLAEWDAGEGPLPRLFRWPVSGGLGRGVPGPGGGRHEAGPGCWPDGLPGGLGRALDGRLVVLPGVAAVSVVTEQPPWPGLWPSSLLGAVLAYRAPR